MYSLSMSSLVELLRIAPVSCLELYFIFRVQAGRFVKWLLWELFTEPALRPIPVPAMTEASGSNNFSPVCPSIFTKFSYSRDHLLLLNDRPPLPRVLSRRLWFLRILRSSVSCRSFVFALLRLKCPLFTTNQKLFLSVSTVGDLFHRRNHFAYQCVSMFFDLSSTLTDTMQDPNTIFVWAYWTYTLFE